MSRCSAITKKGEQCKLVATDGGCCKLHMTQGDCVICMESMTRRTCKTIPCGHKFHTKCIDRWKERQNTCPTCRRYFDCSRFKVTLTIEDTRIPSVISNTVDSNVVNTLIPNINSGAITFENRTSDMTFDISEMDELEQLLADLGTSFSNLNPPHLNAEGMTERLIV